MIKRILVYLTNDDSADVVLNYAKVLEEKFGVEVYGLYVKDIRKYELITPSIEGLVVNESSTLLGEWEKIETSNIKEIKAKFVSCFDEKRLLIEEGLVSDTVIETLKYFDLLVIFKEKRISELGKTLLRLHFKPIIFVPQSKNFRLSKVLFANDNGLNANKSISNFIKLFDKINTIEMVTVNDEINIKKIKEYFACWNIQLNEIKKYGDVVSKVLDETEKNDLLVMGDLKYFFMFEKITGKAGVNILEKSERPVFIG